MAEDRFANIFSSSVTQASANSFTFTQLEFGIGIRDKLAIVFDEIYVFLRTSEIALMTALSDRITLAWTISDAVTDPNDYSDRRIIYSMELQRADFGTAASGAFLRMPLKESFAPPMIVLPTRLFFGVASAGLAAAITVRSRLHFRTVPMTTEQQLNEVLEAFQLAS